jgi:hypothetical protein
MSSMPPRAIATESNGVFSHDEDIINAVKAFKEAVGISGKSLPVNLVVAWVEADDKLNYGGRYYSGHAVATNATGQNGGQIFDVSMRDGHSRYNKKLEIV